VIQRLQALFPPTQLTVPELPGVSRPAVAAVVSGFEPVLDFVFAVPFAPVPVGPFPSEEQETTPFADVLIQRLAVIVPKQLQMQGK
jgi:hypothetical protein